jgi:hypothetical protein
MYVHTDFDIKGSGYLDSDFLQDNLATMAERYKYALVFLTSKRFIQVKEALRKCNTRVSNGLVVR